MLCAVQMMELPVAARSAILAWFDASGREFPFRGVADPYAVLVSETMAQQTQIARASAKWTSFLTRFPTVAALAAAGEFLASSDRKSTRLNSSHT